jgi:hypothetical protein
MKNVLKAFWVAILVITIYGLSINLLPTPSIRKGVSEHQNNIIVAESLFYNPRAGGQVLLGSSLTHRMEPRELGPDFFVLGISGAGSSTGIEILKLCDLKPKAVWIESNFLLKEPDREVVDHLTSQPMAACRRYLPCLRESNRPMNLLFSWIKSWKGDLTVLSNPQTVVSAVHHFKAARQSVPDTASVAGRLHEVADFARRLEAAGVEVHFVEYPVHPDLQNTPYEMFVRAEMSKALPDAEFHWIRPDPNVEYRTTDGLHLDTASARQFAHHLLRASSAVRNTAVAVH